MYRLNGRLAKAQKKSMGLHSVCHSCAEVSSREEIACDSKDCPIYYSRTRTDTHLTSERAIIEPFLKLLEELGSEADHVDGLEW